MLLVVFLWVAVVDLLTDADTVQEAGFQPDDAVAFQAVVAGVVNRYFINGPPFFMPLTEHFS